MGEINILSKIEIQEKENELRAAVKIKTDKKCREKYKISARRKVVIQKQNENALLEITKYYIEKEKRKNTVIRD